MGPLFSNYDVGDFYDEMFVAPGKVRPHYQKILERFEGMEQDERGSVACPLLGKSRRGGPGHHGGTLPGWDGLTRASPGKQSRSWASLITK